MMYIVSFEIPVLYYFRYFTLYSCKQPDDGRIGRNILLIDEIVVFWTGSIFFMAGNQETWVRNGGNLAYATFLFMPVRFFYMP
jgi:hypothetical protein